MNTKRDILICFMLLLIAFALMIAGATAAHADEVCEVQNEQEQMEVVNCATTEQEALALGPIVDESTEVISEVSTPGEDGSSSESEPTIAVAPQYQSVPTTPPTHKLRRQRHKRKKKKAYKRPLDHTHKAVK
jgi:hypothetical protein